VCNFTDYFVIGTGMSRQQLHAVGQHVEEVLKSNGCSAYNVDGYGTSTWLVLDYGDVVVHIFSAEARRYYDLERLWGDARVVTWCPAARKT
jgi:ribosome-associated protein